MSKMLGRLLDDVFLKNYVVGSYSTACANGFHDVELSIPHYLMLVVSELGEAIEADRCGRRADMIAFEERIHVYPDEVERFRAYVKDSVEDELADVCIRLFDLCGTLGIYPCFDSFDAVCESYRSQLRGKSFCEQCYYLSSCFFEFDYGDSDNVVRVPHCVGTALCLLFCMAEDMCIDIWRHIDMKMKYNSRRIYRHGKLY